MPTRTSMALLALLFLALTTGAPRPVSAQVVPRLVHYARNNTVVSACSVEAQTSLSSRRTIAYDRGNWTETIAIYSGNGCSPESNLYTVRAGGRYVADSASPWVVAYRTVTPTAIGAAYLQQQCSQYSWGAGVTQNLSSTGCESIASLTP
jgi:hypothetical protein